MDLKVPPQNLEAERAVIGSILIDSDSASKVMDFLREDHFYDPRNALIFGVIAKLFAEGKAIDVLTLTDELKKIKKLKQSGGPTYISEIVSEVPTSANIVDYAMIVKEKATRRNLITFSGKLAEDARMEDKPLEEVLDELESNILGLSTDASTKDFEDVDQLLELHMQRADEYAKNPNALRGIATGLRDVDKIFGGLHRSDLIILAARPSVGKSTLAVHFARHAAVNEKKHVAIFSLEMPNVQVLERMLAQQMGVNLWNLRMGKLTNDEYSKFAEGSGKLSEAKIFFDDTSGIGMVQLRSKLRKLAIEQGVDLVIIDYLQLMQTREIENRAQAVGEISRSLKILARELDIPIVVLSQLNRAVENRADRMPQLSDLRESGAIEQDADIVIFLSRELVAEEDLDPAGKQTIDFIVAKHRNGAIGHLKLDFYPAQQRFTDHSG